MPLKNFAGGGIYRTGRDTWFDRGDRSLEDLLRQRV